MIWFSWSWLLVELIGELFQGLFLPIDLHLDLALLGVQHNRLLAQTADHVEGTLWPAA
jgi:hypothetical protein